MYEHNGEIDRDIRNQYTHRGASRRNRYKENYSGRPCWKKGWLKKDRARKDKVKLKGRSRDKERIFLKIKNRGKEEMSKEESSGTENRRKIKVCSKKSVALIEKKIEKKNQT